MTTSPALPLHGSMLQADCRLQLTTNQLKRGQKRPSWYTCGTCPCTWNSPDKTLLLDKAAASWISTMIINDQWIAMHHHENHGPPRTSHQSLTINHIFVILCHRKIVQRKHESKKSSPSPRNARHGIPPPRRHHRHHWDFTPCNVGSRWWHQIDRLRNAPWTLHISLCKTTPLPLGPPSVVSLGTLQPGPRPSLGWNERI